MTPEIAAAATEHCSRRDCALVDKGRITTLLAWNPTYDRDGKLISKDPNRVMTQVKCNTCGVELQVVEYGNEPIKVTIVGGNNG